MQKFCTQLIGWTILWTAEGAAPAFVALNSFSPARGDYLEKPSWLFRFQRKLFSLFQGLLIHLGKGNTP